MMLKSPSQGRRGRKFAVRALMLAAVLAGAYYGVPLIRDYWLLWQLETEYSELQTFAHKKAERSQDPQFFRDWGGWGDRVLAPIGQGHSRGDGAPRGGPGVDLDGAEARGLGGRGGGLSGGAASRSADAGGVWRSVRWAAAAG